MRGTLYRPCFHRIQDGDDSSGQPNGGKAMPQKSKRELIEPNPGDKRFIRRDENGRIKESADVGRSLAQDVKKDAKSTAKRGQGDRGDRK